MSSVPGADIGIGTKVAVSTDDGTTFVDLVGVRDISFPEAVADDIEITNQDSPNRTKEYIAGLIDNGEVTIQMVWVPASATDTLLAGLAASGETIQLRFTANVTGATGEVFEAYAKRYARTAPVGDLMTAECVFRISAAV